MATGGLRRRDETMLTGSRDDLKDWKREVLKGLTPLLDRREFLRAAMVGSAALAGGGALAGRVAAAGAAGGKVVKTGTFYFPRLLFHVRDDTAHIWNTYPMADVRVRARLSQLTNINVSTEPVVVELRNLRRMCRYPFIFATSEGDFDIPPNEEKNLREFLLRGGFMHFDDCVIGHTCDLHCGWTNSFFTTKLNEESIRMGINIIIYYLTH